MFLFSCVHFHISTVSYAKDALYGREATVSVVTPAGSSQVCLGNWSCDHLFLSPVLSEKTTEHICRQQLFLERLAVVED